MNKHNFRQFNPNRYKPHLSPFGQTVLDTLITHWRTGSRRRQQSEESNRNTSCRESSNSSRHRHVSCSPTPARRTQNESTHNSNNDDFLLPPKPGYKSKRAKIQTLCFNNEPDVQLNQLYSQNIPQDCLPAVTEPSDADELIKAVTVGTANDEEILTANDMITPVIDFTDKQNKNLLGSQQFNDDTDIPARKFLEILNKDENLDGIVTSISEVIKTRENIIEGHDVNWDDIFDTELFQILNNDPKHTMKPNIYNNENRSKITTSCDTAIRTEKSADENEAGNIEAVMKKSNKCSLNQTKVTKTITKKVKKASSKEKDIEKVIKNNFRKVKYTKAVKNWLENVDPSMQNAEDFPENVTKNKDQVEKLPVVSSNTKQVTSNDKIVAPVITELSPIIVEKKAKDKIKKVIQATLAQKDGKMKFKLPVKDQIESKTEAAEDKKKKIKDEIKKKTKPKFIAPIKSQIPVKSVQFDVCTVDERNLNRIKNATDTDSGNTDVVIVLVYSNDFCQLNNEHTEETCVPEGILVQINDTFFFIKGDNAEYGEILKEVIEKCHVICYNAKQLLIHLMMQFGIELQQGAFNISDAKIGASLIDPDSPPENFAEMQKFLSFTPEYTIATDCVLQKTAWYSTLLKECFTKLKSLLIENSVWSVFVDIEMPVLPVIAGMEYQGVSVDLEKLKSMQEVLLTKMNAVEQECYKAAGKTFQINSALQVRTILYDELQLDTKSNLKIMETIGKGAKSTSEEMLRGLVSVHPLPRLILEYRHLHKAHATFLTGVAQHVKDGLVKPTWVQTAAATGRIASNNPNLQAIPKAPFSLVMFPDDTDVQEAALNFRSVYVARAGHELLAADFKHIECRVFALCAGDAALLAALQSDDLFRVLAAQWLGVAEAAVPAAARARTKRVVYASLYGAGARRLAAILQEPYDQALAMRASFHRSFPALQRFARAAVSRAARGALRSLCGRARRFPHLASADAARRAQAERQAVNFAVQASAADLCKKAMAATARQLQRARLPGRLLLQLHDELVWELRREQLEPAAGAAPPHAARAGVGAAPRATGARGRCGTAKCRTSWCGSCAASSWSPRPVRHRHMPHELVWELRREQLEPAAGAAPPHAARAGVGAAPRAAGARGRCGTATCRTSWCGSCAASSWSPRPVRHRHMPHELVWELRREQLEPAAGAAPPHAARAGVGAAPRAAGARGRCGTATCRTSWCGSCAASSWSPRPVRHRHMPHELVWELRREQLEPAAGAAPPHAARRAAAVQTIIKETMENIGRSCGLQASLPVALSRGPSWGELRPLGLAPGRGGAPDSQASTDETTTTIGIDDSV